MNPVEEKLNARIRELEYEAALLKRSRVEYQSIVYAVACALEVGLGRNVRVGQGLPMDREECVEAARELVERAVRAEAARDELLAKHDLTNFVFTPRGDVDRLKELVDGERRRRHEVCRLLGRERERHHADAVRLNGVIDQLRRRLGEGGS